MLLNLYAFTLRGGAHVSRLMQKQPVSGHMVRARNEVSALSYADRQRLRDAAHARDFSTWIASLSPEEKAKAIALGVAQPDISRRTSTRAGDAVTLTLAATPDPTPRDTAAESDPPVSPHASDYSQPTAADAIASFCARIRSHPNLPLAFDAACFATGLMDVEGLSQTDLAARHGVTRAAFSKLAVQWCDTFGLNPSRGMRSKRARQSYRAARLTSLSKQHDHRRPSA
jgi:hypothetical protein